MNITCLLLPWLCRDAHGVPEDMASIVRWQWQARGQGAPTNKHIDQLCDMLLDDDNPGLLTRIRRAASSAYMSLAMGYAAR